MEEATGGGDGVPDERLLSKMVAKWLMMLRLKARKLVPFLAELDLVMLGVGGEEEIEREIDTLSSSVKDILRVVREGILTLQCVLVNYNTQNTDNGLPALNTLVCNSRPRPKRLCFNRSAYTPYPASPARASTHNRFLSPHSLPRNSRPATK